MSTGLASSYLRRHRGLLLHACFWRALFVLLPMQVPILTGRLVDALATPGQGDPHRVVLETFLGLLAIAFAHGGSSYGQKMVTARVDRRFIFELRTRLADVALGLSIDQHQSIGAGELIDRVIADASVMRRFVDRVIIQSITNVLRLGYPLMAMAALDPLLGLLGVSVVVPQLLIGRIFDGRLHAAARVNRELRADLTTSVKESLDGIESLQALHAEAIALERIEIDAKAVENAGLDAKGWSARIYANTMFWTRLGYALVWGAGALRVLNGSLSIGELVIFTGLLAFVYRPFRQFSNIAVTYRNGLVALERIDDLVNLEPTVSDAPDAVALVASEGRIRLQGLAYSWAEQVVFEGLDLEIPPRSMTVFVGRSGAGKTTLARLLARVLEPSAGEISIDGQILTGCTLSSVRRHVALVSQLPLVISGTIRENLRLAAPEASDEELIEALRHAEAWSFVESIGLDGRLGRGGRGLSIGQQQRLALARALLREPLILVLDEPTSAVDGDSESSIVATLKRLSEEMTVVVIAHRPEAVRHADLVVILDDGRIVDQGTWDELSARSETFESLFGDA